MKKIGLFEAKTNLSKIAERVNRTGQSVVLTKRGEPFVDLTPHHGASPTVRSQTAILADLEALRQQLPKSSLRQIQSDIQTGRR